MCRTVAVVIFLEMEVVVDVTTMSQTTGHLYREVKVQVFLIVCCQVWRPILLHPGRWTCSFMCHFNSLGSIQSCSRFGALNLSYTLQSLSYQVLFSPESSEAFEGEVSCPRTQQLNNDPRLRGGETWYFSENPAPSGIRKRTLGSNIGSLKTYHLTPLSLDLFIYVPFQLPGEHTVLTVAPCPSQTYIWVINWHRMTEVSLESVSW